MIVLPDEVISTDRGVLVNYKRGYDLHWLRSERWALFWSKTIYEIEIHPMAPMTFRNCDGYWQPDRHAAETDLGSIPPPLRAWFPQDEYAPSYIFHDSAYREGGLYYSATLDGPYTFKRLTRKYADDMLADTIHVLGGWACRRGPIWAAVRLLGWMSFVEASSTHQRVAD